MFLYIGGESPWNIRITGYAFDICKGDFKGFNDVTAWYAKENVSKTGGYCELTIGSQVFKGYLIPSTSTAASSKSKVTVSLMLCHSPAA